MRVIMIVWQATNGLDKLITDLSFFIIDIDIYNFIKKTYADDVIVYILIMYYISFWLTVWWEFIVNNVVNIYGKITIVLIIVNGFIVMIFLIHITIFIVTEIVIV